MIADLAYAAVGFLILMAGIAAVLAAYQAGADADFDEHVDDALDVAGDER